jgi:hypothetical protein
MTWKEYQQLKQKKEKENGKELQDDKALHNIPDNKKCYSPVGI